MSVAELQTFVSDLTQAERKTLRGFLNAAEEGVPVEEFEAMDAAVEEALDDPSPQLSAEQVFAELRLVYPLSHAAQA